jgi:hypothetical protein
VSDSPSKLLKGAMYVLSNSVYYLTSVFYDSHLTSTPSSSDLHTYGYIQSFSVWNQFRGNDDPLTSRGRGINIFSGHCFGLGTDWPDLIHKYSDTDSHPQTDDRDFMLLSFNQDWRTCIWNGVFIEVNNSAIGKLYSDDHEFKYITGE